MGVMEGQNGWGRGRGGVQAAEIGLLSKPQVWGEITKSVWTGACRLFIAPESPDVGILECVKQDLSCKATPTFNMYAHYG